MGRIQGPYGVKGWLKARAFTALPDALLDYDRWWLSRSGEEWRECKVLSARLHSDSVLVEIDGVGDRVAAAMWRGALVGVPRAALPQLGRGEFYWADLLGFAVVNRAGEVLGEVRGLLETAAHAVLQVAGEDGRERLIPVVAAYVDAIDATARRIAVDWSKDY
jgi:16S rRNA processing protein RimM